MEWAVTYLGSVAVPSLDLDEYAPIPDLTDELQGCVKAVRKAKTVHDAVSISVSTHSLAANPTDKGTTSIFQPIGKIVFLKSISEGNRLKRAHLFAYIATDEGSYIGAKHPAYTCHVFKCKNEGEATAIAFATARMMSANAHKRPEHFDIGIATEEDMKNAISYWNANNPMLHYFSLDKNGISGNVRVECSASDTLKTVSKVVKLSTSTSGEQLVKLLAEKFNLGDVDLAQFAVFVVKDDSQDMLEDETPISIALTLRDPAEARFSLRKLPPGLVRVSALDTLSQHRNSLINGSSTTSLSVASQPNTGSPRSNPNTTADLDDVHSHPQAITSTPAPKQASRQQQQQQQPRPSITLTGLDGGSTSTDNPAHAGRVGGEDVHAGDVATGEEPEGEEEEDSPLGPVLPYNEDDEDLLLMVMISRQTGNLGFKLTPAYLLQMCIAYCCTRLGYSSLVRLLTKIATEINKVIVANSENPNILLFWASNAIKLMESLEKDPNVFGVFSSTTKALMDENVQLTLSGLMALAEDGVVAEDLQEAKWATEAELRAVIEEHYRAIDQNMSHESLRNVVNRITSALPAPASPGEHEDGDDRDAGYQHQRQPQQFHDASRHSPQALSHGMQQEHQQQLRAHASEYGDVLDQHNGADHYPHLPADGEEGDGHYYGHHIPLPPEWEELIDQETKHRFFANHETRQTSWTDPRDHLLTVNLIKGDKGLGLGISGAKRTRDGRLVLGIFVSSLVTGSAAAVDGTLKNGDEILEVNGQSLIGVNREGAIEFLKQVEYGDTVSLLVAQEPELPIASEQQQMQQNKHTRL